MSNDSIAQQASRCLPVLRPLLVLFVVCGIPVPMRAQPSAAPLPTVEVRGMVRCWAKTPTGLAPQVTLTVRASGPLRLLALSGLFQTANFAPTPEVWATQYHVDQHLDYQLTLQSSQRLQAWPPLQMNVAVSARMVPQVLGEVQTAESMKIQDLPPLTIPAERCAAL